jgi:hypothetical protein
MARLGLATFLVLTGLSVASAWPGTYRHSSNLGVGDLGSSTRIGSPSVHPHSGLEFTHAYADPGVLEQCTTSSLPHDYCLLLLSTTTPTVTTRLALADHLLHDQVRRRG